MSSVIPASSHPASTSSSSSILDPASLSIALPAGNAPPHIKRASLALLEAESAQFGAGVLRRVKLADVSVDTARVHRTQTTFAFDVVIGENMVDVRGQLTVACAAFLVESCASVAAAASALGSSPVLQATNLHYHAPASAYHRLRVICRVLSAAGNRDAPPIAGMPAVSVYAEVWDETTGHLCVSGSLTAQSPATAAASMALQPARL